MHDVTTEAWLSRNKGKRKGKVNDLLPNPAYPPTHSPFPSGASSCWKQVNYELKPELKFYFKLNYDYYHFESQDFKDSSRC